MAAMLMLAAGGSNCRPAAADELILPSSSRDRDASIDAVYRFDRPLTGHGHLDLEWTDAAGRLVEQRRVPLDLSAAPEVHLSLDGGRAVTVKNRLAVHVSVDPADESGGPLRYDGAAAAAFFVPPAGDPWSDYQIIIWQRQTAAAYAALRELGVTAGAVLSDRGDAPGAPVNERIQNLLDADLGWYLENVATDFYSAYHKWSPGRPVNWAFREAKRRYRTNPADHAALIREPGLSDPDWLGKIARRLTATVRALQPYRPLFYDLGDETGVADLSAFWDFDLSPASLSAMRQWLKERYGDLAHLNAEWETGFGRWEDVLPLTTPEAVKRAGRNFAAWADFKEWMDVAFAGALMAGRDAVHAADPEALAAIEGGQVPGWGGYDYARLAASLDAMELGDVGESDRLLRSFNPRAVMLTVSFGSGPSETHRLWRQLLRGSRGIILWDDAHRLVGEDGHIGEQGRVMAASFGELRGGLGALLIHSRAADDRVRILYSPASMRLEWLLERRRSGDDWTKRSAESELADTPSRSSTRRFAGALDHLGLGYRFVSAAQVDGGELAKSGCRVLILPRAIALSDRGVAAIGEFIERGGTVIADGEPGLFDDHGRGRQTAVLAGLFSERSSPAASGPTLGRGRALRLPAPDPRDREAQSRLRDIFAMADVAPPIGMSASDGRAADDVEMHVFRNGAVVIVALLRDLPPTSSGGRPSEAAPETVALKLPQAFELYDLRARRRLGVADRVEIAVGSDAPALLALSPRPLAGPSLVGPASARLGETAAFRIAPNGDPIAALDIAHVEVTDPAGNRLRHYGANLPAPAGKASFTLPLALSDPPGLWTIRADSILGGADVTARLQVEK